MNIFGDILWGVVTTGETFRPETDKELKNLQARLELALAAHNTFSTETLCVRKALHAKVIPASDDESVMTCKICTDYGYPNAVMGLMLYPSGHRRRSLCERAIRIVLDVWHVLHECMHPRDLIHGDVRNANVSVPHPDHEGFPGYPDAMLGGFLAMKPKSRGEVAEDVMGIGRFLRELVTLTPDGSVEDGMWRAIRTVPKLSPLVNGGNETETHVVTTLVVLADLCVLPDAKERPDMLYIRDILQMCLDHLRPPCEKETENRRVSDCGSSTGPVACGVVQQSHRIIRDQ